MFQTSLLAIGVAGVLTGRAGAVFFAGFIALPACYFVTRALMWRGAGTQQDWYPVQKILAEMTILAAFTLMVLALASEHQGGLKSFVPVGFAESFKDADPDFAAAAQQLAGSLSYVLFASAGWLWVIMVYAMALLANAILASKDRALRLSLALHSQGLPVWLLLLLVLSGGMATMGEGLDRFTAEAIFLLLLLPYLLSGLAYVHLQADKRGFAMRRLWIICFYIVLVVTRWPALALIAIGLYLQLAEMLDRRKGMR